jgi:hypothetical protein
LGNALGGLGQARANVVSVRDLVVQDTIGITQAAGHAPASTQASDHTPVMTQAPASAAVGAVNKL